MLLCALLKVSLHINEVNLNLDKIAVSGGCNFVTGDAADMFGNLNSAEESMQAGVCILHVNKMSISLLQSSYYLGRMFEK